jgi:CheY-like chemotaxis protein
MFKKEAKSKVILAVDDDPFIRKMFHSMLEPKGFRVFTANNGAEAVSRALQIKPDIIFLDLMMPEVDGFRALEILRGMEQTSHIPIIIVTARADSATLLRVIKLGANDFIAKPFSRPMIMRKIKFALMPPTPTELNETESDAINKTTTTFIHTSLFKEMKSGYIFKFDHIFLTLIRLLSAREKHRLIRMLEEVSTACSTYDILDPLPLVQSTIDMVKKENWNGVMKQLEKIYAIFKDLQTKQDAKQEAAGKSVETQQEVDPPVEKVEN